MATTDQDDRELAHLRWLCRRGAKELDLALESFLQQYYAQLSAEEVQCFTRMLGESDVKLLSWLFGRTEPEDQIMKTLFERIRRCAVVDDPA